MDSRALCGTRRRSGGREAVIWQLELLLYAMLVAVAIIALSVRDLIAAVAALSAFSFLAASLLALMGAVDVSLTEVALGAGITGVLLVGSISLMHRRSVD